MDHLRTHLAAQGDVLRRLEHRPPALPAPSRPPALSRTADDERRAGAADYRLEYAGIGRRRGFDVVRTGDQAPVPRRMLLRDDGLESVGVVGVTAHMAALQDTAFDPGRELAIVPEATGLTDRPALAVWDAARRHRVGYLPANYARDLAKALREGPIRCFAIWEVRQATQRIALRALLVKEHTRLTGPAPVDDGWP